MFLCLRDGPLSFMFHETDVYPLRSTMRTYIPHALQGRPLFFMIRKVDPLTTSLLLEFLFCPRDIDSLFKMSPPRGLGSLLEAITRLAHLSS